jgi:hypothetical protein
MYSYSLIRRFSELVVGSQEEVMRRLARSLLILRVHRLQGYTLGAGPLDTGWITLLSVSCQEVANTLHHEKNNLHAESKKAIEGFGEKRMDDQNKNWSVRAGRGISSHGNKTLRTAADH